MAAPSETGTSLSYGSTMPPDPERENAAIWKNRGAERHKQSEEIVGNFSADKRVEVDRWITGFCGEDDRIKDAVVTATRTIDIDFDNYLPYTTDTSGAEESDATSSPVEARQGVSASGQNLRTFGDISRQTLKQKDNAERRSKRVDGMLGRSKSGRRNKPGQEQPALEHGQLEGPIHDLRQLNDGDKLQRKYPDEPIDTYFLPQWPMFKAASQDRSNSRGRGDPDRTRMENELLGPRFRHLLAIADRTGTHLRYNEKTNTVDIWGTKPTVAEAKLYLMYLNKHVDKDIQANARKVGWAKVKAIPDERHRNAATKKAKEKREKDRFKTIPNDEVYPYTGIFAWPHSEVNPAQTLGMNYESLDPIRTDLGVYIVYSSKRCCFRVLGYEHNAVQKALERIYVVFCEIASRNRPPMVMSLTTPPQFYYPEVALEKDDDYKSRPVTVRLVNASGGVVCRLSSPDGNPVDNPAWITRRDTLKTANERYIKSTLTIAVRDVYNMRGYAKLRVYFGTLVLLGYRRPKEGPRHELEEFFKMIQNPLTKGEIVRDLGNEALAKRLRQYVEYRNDMFTSANPQEGPQDNRIIDPIYSTSMFVIVDQTPDPRIELKLEVEFEKSATGSYRVASRRWLKLPRQLDDVPEVARKRSLLDIKRVELDHDISHHIELVYAPEFNDAEKFPVLSEFVLHLQLEDTEDRETKRVSYIALPRITVTSIVTKQKFKYWLYGGPYMFELTKYNHVRGNDLMLRQNIRKGGFPTNYQLQSTTDVRWGVSLYSADWDTNFSKQTGLPAGCHGDWSPHLQNFLSAHNIVNDINGKKGKGKENGKGDREKSGGHAEDPEGEDASKEDGFKGLLKKIKLCAEFIADVKLKFRIEQRRLADNKAREAGEAYDSDWDDGQTDMIAVDPENEAQASRQAATGEVPGNIASVYGDTEYSKLAKDRLKTGKQGPPNTTGPAKGKAVLVDAEDNVSRYGDTEYSALEKEITEPVKGRTISIYGDSQYSEAAKKNSRYK